MRIAVVTGSAGLIGSEAVRYLTEQGFTVVGIDSDMRRCFFGDEASTDWSRRRREEERAEYKNHGIMPRSGFFLDFPSPR
jgi:CDP-paratose 2-epimerase